MVEIKSIVKIKKQSYRCELRKKFSNKKKFRIVEKRPLDLVGASIKQALSSRGGSGIIKLLVTFAILAFLLVSAIVLLPSIFQGQSGFVQKGSTVPPRLDVVFEQAGAGSFGGLVPNSIAQYSKINYSAQNADNLTVTSGVYAGRVPNQVFILISKMDQSSTYPEFKYSLKKRLEAKGLSLNEISLNQLDTLPGGAMLIVPSGLIPQKMTEPGGANILSLAQRGVVVLYIGQRFDGSGFAITETGTRKSIDPQFASKVPFQFTAATIGKTSYLNLLSTLYTAEASSRQGNLLYGMVSQVTDRNWAGTVLIVPQVLDHGWSTPDDAAADIDKIITEFNWVSPVGVKTYHPQFSRNSTLAYFISPQFPQRSGMSVITKVAASNSAGETEKIQVTYPEPDVRGDLFYIEDTNSIVSGKITELDTQFAFVPGENSSEERRLFLSVRDISNQELKKSSIAQGASGTVSLLTTSQFSNRLDFDSGTYIASIVDEAGNAYAKMIVVLSDVSIQQARTDFQRSVFNFSATADSNPVPIKQMTVTVDGKYSYQFRDASDFGINMYDTLKGESLPAGDHTFVFDFSGIRRTVTLTRVVRSQFYENPLIWVLGAMALVLFVGAPYLAFLTRKVEYALDIPDFPPLSSMKIPLRRQTVLSVIEKVNEDYRWRQVPLTLEEMKKGFKKIIYQNKPIFISDYNLEYILEKMMNRGEVKKALDYYGLGKWESETGRSIKYLAIQRKIRDICINEAIPFNKGSDKPEQNDGYDIYLKVLGQDVFTYVMDTPETREQKLSSAIKQMQKGLVVLLFENAEERRDFEDTINSASEAGGLVKMEIMAGSVVPLGIGEFEKMLKEMKNV